MSSRKTAFVTFELTMELILEVPRGKDLPIFLLPESINSSFRKMKNFIMYTTTMRKLRFLIYNCQSRQKRDLAMDFYNPREELSKDVTSERLIDQIPDFKPQVVDLSHSTDYQARDQVKLVQDARANFANQANMYDNPQFNSSGEGRGDRGMPAPDVYSGSAAGLRTNRLVEDEDGTQVANLDNVQAF